MKNIRNTRAITLISLVITVIVLLILAAVTLSLTLGNNGIFKTAEKAGENYTKAQEKELGDLTILEQKLQSITNEIGTHNGGSGITGDGTNVPSGEEGTQTRKWIRKW